MRTWAQQRAHEASEKQRMRAEWLQQAAVLKLGVTEAAQQLGMSPATLQKEFTRLGIKSERAFHVDLNAARQVIPSGKKPQTQRQKILQELRDRAEKKVAAGMKPDYARIEAAREMQREVGR